MKSGVTLQRPEALSRIEPAEGLEPSPETLAAIAQPRPDLVWLPLDALRVNEAYQRPASGSRSMKVIRGGVEAFDWRKVKPLSVARTGDVYEVLNGRHTAVIFATVGLREVPCIVHDDAGDIAERAGAFVGLNRDQVAVTAFALFWADVAAGQAEAVSIRDAADAADVEIPRRVLVQRERKSRQVFAIASLRRLQRERGGKAVRDVLRVCADCLPDRPVPLVWLKAAEKLICDPSMEYAPDALIRAVTNFGADRLARMAKDAADKTGDFHHHALAVAASRLMLKARVTA